MPKNNLNVAILAIGALVGAASCYLVMQMYQTSSNRLSSPSAFYLGVKVSFTSEDDKLTFQSDFSKLAEFVRDFEPQTLSYELLQSDKDPLHIYIMERYKNKKAYLEIHKQSKEFIEFRARFQKMIESKSVIVDGQSYVETGIGFV